MITWHLEHLQDGCFWAILSLQAARMRRRKRGSREWCRRRTAWRRSSCEELRGCTPVRCRNHWNLARARCLRSVRRKDEDAVLLRGSVQGEVHLLIHLIPNQNEEREDLPRPEHTQRLGQRPSKGSTRAQPVQWKEEQLEKRRWCRLAQLRQSTRRWCLQSKNRKNTTRGWWLSPLRKATGREIANPCSAETFLSLYI